VDLVAVAPGVEAEHAPGAGGGAVQPHQQPDRGGLAGAVRAEESEHGARRDLEIEMIERDGVAVVLGESVGLDHRRDHRRHHAARPLGPARVEGPGRARPSSP